MLTLRALSPVQTEVSVTFEYNPFEEGGRTSKPLPRHAHIYKLTKIFFLGKLISCPRFDLGHACAVNDPWFFPGRMDFMAHRASQDLPWAKEFIEKCVEDVRANPEKPLVRTEVNTE